MLILYPYCHKIIALKNLVSVSIFEIFHVANNLRIINYLPNRKG